MGLTKTAVQALMRYGEQQRAAGHPAEGDTLVFTNTVGKPVDHSHFRRKGLKPLLERAGLPDNTWHAATRHTCACILLLEGVNPKSVAFMLETYARFLPGWGDGGAMDAALG